MPIDVLLLIAPGCPHCKTVLDGLGHLIKEGRIGKLEVIHLGAHPEAARQFGVRSAPWIKIGRYQLTGSYSPSELADWVAKAESGEGDAAWLQEMLQNQQLDEAIHQLRQTPQLTRALLALAADKDTPMGVRIGIAALVEELAPEGVFHEWVQPLAELATSDVPYVRADGAHYLGLSGNPSARPFLQALLNDPITDVREIAAESLALLDNP